MYEGAIEVAKSGVDLGERVVRGACPGVVPARLVEGVVCFIVPAEKAERDPQQVERFSVVGVWVAAREPVSGGLEVSLGEIEFAASQVP